MSTRFSGVLSAILAVGMVALPQKAAADADASSDASSTKYGEIIGDARSNHKGFGAENGDIFFILDQHSIYAKGGDSGKNQNVFVMSDKVRSSHNRDDSYVSIWGQGNQNILILPGKQNDYTIRIADEPKNIGSDSQFGDIIMSRPNNTGTGRQIFKLSNIQSVVFTGKETPNWSVDEATQAMKDNRPISTSDLFNAKWNGLNADQQYATYQLYTQKDPIIKEMENSLGEMMERKNLEILSRLMPKANSSAKGKQPVKFKFRPPKPS